MSCVVRSAVRPSASILPPCVGIDLPFRLFSVYCLAVDNGPPWRLSFVPAVLLALYCPAVDNGLPCRLSFVPAVLLALYCRAVDNGPPWCPFLPSC